MPDAKGPSEAGATGAEQPSGAVRITRRPTKSGQRVWFSCPACGTYGHASGSVDATEYVVESLAALGHPASCADSPQSGPSGVSRPDASGDSGQVDAPRSTDGPDRNGEGEAPFRSGPEVQP